jgi:hypothetical protein
MSVNLEVVIEGSSIEVSAWITDFPRPTPTNPNPAPVYIDPDANSVTIYDDQGTVVVTLPNEEIAIVRDGVGLYHVDYEIPSSGFVPGKWLARWIATQGGLPSKGEAYFNVIP